MCAELHTLHLGVATDVPHYQRTSSTMKLLVFEVARSKKDLLTSLPSCVHSKTPSPVLLGSIPCCYDGHKKASSASFSIA